MTINAEILTAGDELLRGDLTDTNATWLAGRLFRLGVSVHQITSLGDDLQSLVDHLVNAMANDSLVVVTGGLGPTEDDRTTEAVAKALGLELQLDQEVLALLKRRFEAAGYPFTPNNEKQACFPTGAQLVPNHRGTAPGFWVSAGGSHVVCLPGVPSEMKAMFDEDVVPLLSAAGIASRPAVVRVVRAFGIGESMMDQRLQGLLTQISPKGQEGLTLHYRTSFPENQVILVVRRDAREDAGEILHRFEAEVRRRLGHVVFGIDETSFSDAVVKALREANATMALAESCTGGLAGDLITRASGSSSVFELGVITYSNACKQRMLGVPEQVLKRHGAVSRECVEAMATGVRDLAAATYGVSISGVAGPTGGSPDKPVGTVHFGLAHPDGVVHLERRFPWVDDRQRIKVAAAHVALGLVLRHVTGALDKSDPFLGRWSKRTETSRPEKEGRTETSRPEKQQEQR